MPRFLLLFALLTLAGCSFFTPYRVPAEQGNVITQELLSQVSTGMTAAQVKFILGTPLLTTPNSQDHWLYYYQDGETTQQSIHLYFEDDSLQSIEGQAILTEKDIIPATP